MAMKKCPQCAMSIPNESKVCPYCRKKFGWTTGAKAGLCLILTIIFAAWFSSREPSQQKVIPFPQKNQSTEFEINIGKTLFSERTGEEIGKIVGVHYVPMTERMAAHPVYKVNCEGDIVLYPSVGFIVRDVPSTKAKYPKPIVGKVDDSLKEIASEFCSRLARNDGQLQCMYLKEGCIIVEWSSEKCDYCRSEILDFVLSINRIHVDHPNSINLTTIHAINFARTCKSLTKNFNISGTTLRNYLADHSHMSDDKLLEGIDCKE